MPKSLDPAREEVLIIRTANGWTVQHSNVVYPANSDGVPFQPTPRDMFVASSAHDVAGIVHAWALTQAKTPLPPLSPTEEHPV
jgi:hypothetical protein